MTTPAYYPFQIPPEDCACNDSVVFGGNFQERKNMSGNVLAEI